MNRVVGLVCGDGIGKEVVPAAAKILNRAVPELKFRYFNAGFEHFQKTGIALPEETVSGLQECDGGIFGAVSSPSTRVAGYSSPILGLRKALNLYANIRPVISDKVNLVIVRENTECLYVKSEFLYTLPGGGKVAWAHRMISQFASERCARVAFRLAESRRKQDPSRDLVTVVHKANVLSVSDGLWRETALEVATEFPNIRVEEQIVDSMVYRLFREPQQFNVVVAPNLYGDILSDGAAALVGSLGLVPSLNSGDSFVLAEPVHGSAPDIAGKGIANPIAAIRSGAMLLDHLGYSSQALKIEEAVTQVIQAGCVTPDLGGTASTQQVTEEIAKNME